MIALAWVVLLALLTAYFTGWLNKQQNPNEQVLGEIVDGAVRQVVLEQNRHGHYVASGRINGKPVIFLLDTGATTVSVPLRVARRLGLEAGRPSSAYTANGVVTTYRVILDRVALGNIALRDVRPHINPGMGGEEVLLGMSFLKQLEFSQRGDSLTLRQLPVDL